MRNLRLILPLTVIICGVFSAFSQTWKLTSAPYTNWFSLAGSSDGTRLIAAATAVEYVIGSNLYQGALYISTNSGVTWQQSTGVPNDNGWYGVASSADGSHLVAAAYGGFIYISTNSGTTWVATGTNNGWNCVASSADGKRLVAGTVDGGIYTNCGESWLACSAPTETWYSVASSADGRKLVAVSSGLYTSTNYGADWTERFANGNWVSVASSADGDKLVALINVGQAFVSTNSGITWASESATYAGWSSASISADGNKIFAAAVGPSPGLYVSTNCGATWTNSFQMAGGAYFDWDSVAISADGNKLVAAANGAGIWTSQTVPSPVLNIATTNGLQLSWLVPSTSLVLQQNSDLGATNWLTITNTPVLSLTNLQNQVMLPMPSDNVFFRLGTP